jgi:hypothetical protein
MAVCERYALVKQAQFRVGASFPNRHFIPDWDCFGISMPDCSTAQRRGLFQVLRSFDFFQNINTLTS